MFWSNKPAVETLPSGISISLKPEDRPRFRRIYTKDLTNGRRVKVEAQTYLISSGRMFSGELTQSNGRWVLFDPKEVADKILDPALVPLVEDFCQEVQRLDRAFMANNPGEFIDEGGAKWQRT